MTSSDGEKITELGTRAVRIFVPSRRRDGGIVQAELRREWRSRAISQLETRPFGGATATDVVGSYVHPDGRVTREDVAIVSTSCDGTILADHDARQRILRFGQDLAQALGQDSVFVGWGDLAHVVSKGFDLDAVPVTPFTQLTPDDQMRHLTMGWGGIETANRILQVLSLDTWTEPPPQSADGFLVLRAVLRGEVTRKAWSWSGEQQLDVEGATRKMREKLRAERRQWKSDDMPRAGDLVFAQSRTKYLDLYLVTASGLAGPRDLALSHGQLNPVTRELLLRVLRREWEGLERDLLQKPLDQVFFPKLRTLQQRLAEDLKDLGEREAFRTSVLLIGRMMFLRFLAQKGEHWLPGGLDGLLKAWNTHGDRFFERYIQPLWFDVLDCEPEQRKPKVRDAFAGYPYINGGLFHAREGERALKLSPAHFDPAVDGSFLHLFREFHFSLNEYAGSDDSLRVDPSLFGKVLETFNSADDKKNDGVHYTPKPIAWALAMEAIASRLSTVTRVPRENIERLALADAAAVKAPEASRIRKALSRLRIVDPAVGSGVLLWACLDVMMAIDSQCDAIESGGVGYHPGCHRWGQRSRHFVCSCLYGVDVSQEAVELTRLRLWLAVALSEDVAQPLPDLELNIVRGDSLAPWPAPVPAAASRKSLKPKQRTNKAVRARQELLPFTEQERVLLQLRQLQLEYERLGEEEPTKQPETRDKISKLRRSLEDSAKADGWFDWRAAFPHVFDTGESAYGFDVVIANPPYVRVQRIGKDLAPAYRKAWQSLSVGNADLCFGFVELALRRLATPMGGEVAFILPNFRSHDAADNLRKLVVGADPAVPSRVRLWVDFADVQVFPTATNYVAMLFAQRSIQPARQAEFEYSNPAKNSWVKDGTNLAWLRPPGGVHVNSAEGEWLTVPPELRKELEAARVTHPAKLGDFVDISVGLQTTPNGIFLFDDIRPSAQGRVEALRHESKTGEWIAIERPALRQCLKGSAARHYWVLFPYDEQGRPLPAATLAERFPLAWEYLRSHEATLKDRAARFSGPTWYRYGRDQGELACQRPKVLVPAMLQRARGVVDRAGMLAFTGSGKGGGGAFALMPKVGGVTLDAIHAAVESPEAWRHIRAHGSPQKEGWRGVDAAVLAGIPCGRLDGSSE